MYPSNSKSSQSCLRVLETLSRNRLVNPLPPPFPSLPLRSPSPLQVCHSICMPPAQPIFIKIKTSFMNGPFVTTRFVKEPRSVNYICMFVEGRTKYFTLKFLLSFAPLPEPFEPNAFCDYPRL